MFSILKKFLGGPRRYNTSTPQPVDGAAFTIRSGEVTPTDQALNAWTSGNLEEMLAALDSKTNKIDRHFLLMGIVDATYKQRSNPKMAQLCYEISEIHLREFAGMVTPLKKDMDGVLPRVTTFQHYATLLSERGDFGRAVEVCELAIGYGLHDGTKSDFPGRVERIKKVQSGT